MSRHRRSRWVNAVPWRDVPAVLLGLAVVAVVFWLIL